jgi:hypothetical protein
MEQSPSSQPNSHWSFQEIPCLLWNTKIHYRVQNSLPLTSILSQINQLHNFPPYFSKTYSNIIPIYA